MKITYFGHSCFLLESEDGISLLTDPYTGVGYELPQGLIAKIVTVSHDHFDHNYVEGVKCGALIDRAGESNIYKIKITGIMTDHDPYGGEKRGKNVVFKTTLDGLTVCHMGDIGQPCTQELLDRLGKVDVLFIPVGGNYTIDAEQAKEYIRGIGAKVTVLMHYRPEDGTVDIADKSEVLRAFDGMVECAVPTYALDITGEETGKIIFMERRRVMEPQMREQFKNECREIIKKPSLNVLRAYGRLIGMQKPAAIPTKAELGEAILSVLCGELFTSRNNRGAPIKNDYIDPAFIEEMNVVLEKYGLETVDLESQGFDLDKALEKPNNDNNKWILEFHDPGYDKFTSDPNPIFFGQITRLNGQFMLLNLNCVNGREILTVPQELVVAHDLRDGDIVSCRMHKGEKAYVAQSVLTINGIEPNLYKRGRFDVNKVCYPIDRIVFALDREYGSVTARYLQWLLPIGKGQRACIVAPPKAGKTTLLADIANLASEFNEDMHVFASLCDQAPEVSSLFRFVQREDVVQASYDDTPEKKIYAADFLLKRAKRFAESGRHVLLLVDSFTALARAYDETELSGGRMLVGELSAKAVQYIVNYFNAARCFERGGSLTIIGAVTSDSGNPADDVLSRAVCEAANLEICLNDELARRRVYPTIDLRRSKIQRGGMLTNETEEQLEGIICSQYLPTFGEEKLRSMLSKNNSYKRFQQNILLSLKQ